MEAVVDIKYRPALYRHGGMVEAKQLGSPAAGVIEPAGVYLECLRNHAASAGGHVVDGCGEFMPAPVASLRCAACGCHRSFHRRVIAEGPPSPPPRLALLPPPSTVVAAAPHLLRYGRPLHDEGTPPEDRVPGAGADDGWDETDEESDYDDGRPMSPLPTPPTGYLAPAPPHMLLLLNTGAPASASAPAAASSRPPAPVPAQGTVSGRSLAAALKRFRTKFSPGQKQRMRELSERLGWRLQRRDEATVADCCREIGVTRGVFKVWMHNNKHNFVGGLHSARRPASSASVSPIPVPAASVVQPSSHTAATPPPAAASASAPPPPPVVHADFNINGSAESYFVQPATATASGGAPQSS